MKKLLVLILTLIMVFSLVSCKSKCEKKGHLDEDKNSICDRCDAVIEANKGGESEDQKGSENSKEPEHNVHADVDTDGRCDGCDYIMIDYSKPGAVGTILRKSLERQFDEVNSLKIEFEVTNTRSENSYDWYYDGDLAEKVYYEVKENSANTQRVEMWIVRNGDTFDAKIATKNVSSYSYVDDANDIDDEYEYNNLIYIIDGYLYTELEGGTFAKGEMDDDEITNILSELSISELISTEERTELLDKLGAEIATVLSIRDNKGSVSIDLKDSVDGVLAYILELDFETDTLETVIDDALANVSVDLTAEAIVTELERIGALTVNEALAELDAWLTENHNTTMQDIYDTVVNNPEFIELFKEIVVMVNQLDATDPSVTEELDAVITEMKAFNLKNFIAEEQIGEVLIYDLIASLIPGEVPTATDLFVSVRAILDMTLAELDENMLNGRLAAIQSAVAYASVDEINAKLDVEFKNVLEVSGVDGSFNFKLTTVVPGEIEDKDGVRTISIKGKLRVYEISNETATVELPKGSEVIDEKLVDGEYESDGGFIDIDYYKFEDEISISISGEYYDAVKNCYVGFYADGLALSDVLADEIVLTDIQFEVEGIEIELLEGSEIKIVIDPKTDSFRVVATPDYEMPPKSYVAFYNYVNYSDSSYTFDGIESIRRSGDEYRIGFNNYPFSFVYCTVDYSDGSLVCTITGFGTSSDYFVRYLDGNSSWYGATYDLEEIEAYFGGDPTFNIAYDSASGSLYIVEYPMIEDQYKDNWPA